VSAALQPVYTPPAVPREHIGQVRALRNGIRDLAAGTAIAAISRKLQARARRRQKLTVSDAVKFRDQWVTEVPAAGRLSFVSKISAHSLIIREVRLVASHVRLSEWPDEDREPGLSIMSIGISSVAGEFWFEHDFIASLSLHALGRRFERGGDKSLVAITADLRAIAEAPHAALGADIEIPVPDGRWVGRVLSVRDALDRMVQIAAVRTFIANRD
jgi:hypothetical protein